jgi:hypothetical protein
MTGYLDGCSYPLSAITVGELADLGYGVSYSAADNYIRPATSTVKSGSSTSSTSSGTAGLKQEKDEDFYGDMRATPVHVTASNTASAMAGPDPTLLGSEYTVFVDTGTARTGADFGNHKVSAAPTIAAVSDSPDPVTTGSSLTLTATGATDSDGTVAKVSFYRESNATSGLQAGTGGDTLIGTDATSSDGFKTTFATTGLAAATYTYYAQATDNAGVTSAAVSCTSVVKSASVSTTGTISGIVFNDLNGNGLKDTGEPGLPNWRVYLDANNNKLFDTSEKSVITPTGGAYSFTGLNAGTYNVREVDQSGWARTANSPVVTLATGATAANQNFPNFKNASIAGKAYNDADRDGVRDSTETGIAGLKVYDDKNNNGVLDSGERSTTTDSSGNYTLGSLVAGARNVRIVLPSGKTLSAPTGGKYAITPMSGQVITGKDFGLKSNLS